jgi:hypothetical protein
LRQEAAIGTLLSSTAQISMSCQHRVQYHGTWYARLSTQRVDMVAAARLQFDWADACP